MSEILIDMPESVHNMPELFLYLIKYLNMVYEKDDKIKIGDLYDSIKIKSHDNTISFCSILYNEETECYYPGSLYIEQ